MTEVFSCIIFLLGKLLAKKSASNAEDLLSIAVETKCIKDTTFY